MSDRSVWALDTPGVAHKASDVRGEIFTAHGGESGLVAHGGGGVVATPGNSASVRVLPCSAVAVSRYPGHVNQSYSFRVSSAVDVPIRPGASTPTSGRTDAVILRVRDLAVEGATIPADPNSVDYWEPHVVEGVPPSTGYTEDGIAARFGITYPFVLIGLARVAAGQSAVAEITTVANTISHQQRLAPPQVINFPAQSLIGQTGTQYQDVGTPAYLDIPRWATHATVTASVSGMVMRDRSSVGWLNAIFANRAMPEPTRWDMDVATGGFTRGHYVTGGTVWLPADRRGTTQEFKLRASNQTGGRFGVDTGSSMHLSVFFEARIDLGG